MSFNYSIITQFTITLRTSTRAIFFPTQLILYFSEMQGSTISHVPCPLQMKSLLSNSFKKTLNKEFYICAIYNKKGLNTTHKILLYSTIVNITFLGERRIGKNFLWLPAYLMFGPISWTGPSMIKLVKYPDLLGT